MKKYEKLGLIGEGSYGRVYKGRDVQTKKLVALKIISQVGRSEKELTSLKSECEIQRLLCHPNIVIMIDSFDIGNDVVVVTEYMDMELSKLLKKDGFLLEDQARKILCDLISALYYLHSHRVLHRDLKPQNVLLDENGTAKLCDFGLARTMSSGTHVLTSIKGTPLYMAPELIEDIPYDHNADLWSLGCIYYEMLVGTPPFTTTSILHLVQLLRYEPIKWPNFLSEPCLDFLQGLLDKNPLERLTWPHLLDHSLIKGSIFIKEEEVKDEDSPFTMPPTVSQIEAKELQKQDIAKKTNRRGSFIKSFRLGRRKSKSENSSTSPSKVQENQNESSRRNSVNEEAEYRQSIFEENDQLMKLAMDDINERLQKLELLCSRKYSSTEENNSDEKQEELPVSKPPSPLVMLPQSEIEEWHAFLQQSMVEVMEGDVMSVSQKGCIDVLRKALASHGSSGIVTQDIATLLGIPFVCESVSEAEHHIILEEYIEAKMVMSLLNAVKLLTHHIDCLKENKSVCNMAECEYSLPEEKLLAINKVFNHITFLVYRRTEFIKQFCVSCISLDLISRLQFFLKMRRTNLRTVLDIVAIFYKILVELPGHSSLIEKVILLNKNAESELHAMMTNDDSKLRERICRLIGLMANFCSQTLQTVWTNKLKSDLESLEYDSCCRVRMAAEYALHEFQNNVPYFAQSGLEDVL